MFVLWNPLIRKLLTLSEPSLPDRIGNSVLYWYAHGLGFDQLNDDYKVVRLVYFIREGDTLVMLPSEVEVFSLKKRYWNRVNGPTIWVLQTLSPVYVKGVVHWICLRVLLLFDVSDDVFRMMG